MTIRYVNHISEVASRICNERGKKTLNVDHILDALKQIGFDSHIKKLQSELDFNQSHEAQELGHGNTQEMKERINKKKKTKKKKEKFEISEEMIEEQKRLFEESRNMLDNDEVYDEECEPTKKRRIDENFLHDEQKSEENYDI